MLEPETDPQPTAIIGLRVPSAAISAYMAAHHQASCSARLFLHHLDRALDGGRTPLALVYICGDEEVVDTSEVVAEADEEEAVEKDELETAKGKDASEDLTKAATTQYTATEVQGSSADEEPPAYICFYVDTRAAPVSAAKLLSVPVPPAFWRVRELLDATSDKGSQNDGAEGGVERLFVPRARVHAYDDAGQIVDHLPVDS